MYSVLLADDEKEIMDFLSLYLEKDGFKVYTSKDGYEAWETLEKEKIDLAIIDIMMPRINGYELIKKIRNKSNMPIMILSAKGESSDKVLGLGIGADDYITKPFDPLEVVARVQANIRRYYNLGSGETYKTLNVRDLTLDTSQCILFKNDKLIELTSIEFKILKLFMESPGRVFTKKQIYEAAWEDSYIVDDNNIMVYISKIREKLGEREGEAYIKTIRGLGYKMMLP
jgi:DNA-binding response OmpR family regulator